MVEEEEVVVVVVVVVEEEEVVVVDWNQCEGYFESKVQKRIIKINTSEMRVNYCLRKEDKLPPK